MRQHNQLNFKKSSLFAIFLLLSITMFSQKTISGTITAKGNLPLPGVNIIQKGTSNGAVSDFDGNYSLNIDDSSSTLVFSSIGFQTLEENIGQRSQISVTLSEDSEQLDEIVVVGYGTQKRSDVTGAISSIKASDIEDAPPLAPEQILQGKVSGVNIIQNSGQPGAASTVRIRGTSSISASNDPLYVVDGVPLQFGSKTDFVQVGSQGGTSPLSSEVSNPLNIINPSDIESIDVLKDASATAIYGSRGANGVIVITTKSKGGGENVSYDMSTGVAYVPDYLPMLSADQFREYATDNNLPFSDEGANTAWQKEIFRAAFSQNHNIAFSGGSDKTKYRSSIGYNKQEGVIIGSAIEKYTARINGTHKAINDKLNVGFNLTYANIEDEKVPISSNIFNEGGNILKDAIRFLPTLPVYNPDGSFYQVGELRINPVSWTEISDESSTNLFLGNVNFALDLTDDLKFTTSLGYSNESLERFTSVPDDHPAGENEGGRASISKSRNTTKLVETNLTYDKEINENNEITLLAGYSFQRFEFENTFTSANQFVSTVTGTNLIQSGSILSNTSFRDANRLVSYFGRLNYKLMDRYLLTLTVRRDGSSRFGENNRFGTFPSGAIAWNVSKESFMQDSFISNMKLRLGYGVTGNQEIPNNLYREQLSINGSAIYVLGGIAVPSVLPVNFANPDLKWEETSQTNFGIDFGFFDQRLYGSFDYYVKNTNDLLLEFNTAAPSVVETQFANVGEVRNKGFEISLNYDVVDKKDFTWTTNVNFSKNENEVISLSNDNFSRDQILISEGSGVVSNDATTQIIKPGLPLGSFYGRVFTGYDADGLETYRDTDGVEGADLDVIGNPFPDFIYGFNNSFRYKNVDISLNFRGVVGNDIYNNTAAEFSYISAAPGTNVLESALTLGASREQVSQYSSQWIEDGSYFRLDNASIGYTFNTDNLKLFNKMRMYITGKNLFVITGYSGYDPEVRTRAEGIDYLAYPRPRTFLLGLNVSL